MKGKKRKAVSLKSPVILNLVRVPLSNLVKAAEHQGSYSLRRRRPAPYELDEWVKELLKQIPKNAARGVKTTAQTQDFGAMAEERGSMEP